MSEVVISDSIKYVGANDHKIDLFESQYVVPNGVSYNSYVILDEKIAVMDTVDWRATDEWFDNVEKVLDGRMPEYLVVSHLEPDHASNIDNFVKKYPTVKLVGNVKTFNMLPQFFDLELTDEQKVVVAEGDKLSLGEHTLQFFMAPMVHWPEVMVEYEEKEKVLFSADGFGKFGALDVEEDWACEARRYYFNICGKYGVQVQALLKKAATLDIQTICPLHGPILKENLGYYIGLYDTWSKYEAESEGIFVAYASIHGNTKKTAEEFAEMLKAAGAPKVSIADLSRDDMAEAIEDAFRYDRLVLAAPTYDGGLFPVMNDFLSHLAAKAYQKRTVGLIENGSWGPMAAKKMREQLESMKDITVLEPVVTIKSTMNDANKETMKQLVKELVR
ncbi:MAG: FprA family A-type flavoprotein [Pseudobutyrivibrio sp.]|nr:FprA family A-type flavoprotein [Pseudobutyrivibrio sp.]